VPYPAHQPTGELRQQVEAYAAVGIPHHDIAKLIKIDTKTMLKYYEEELSIGKAKANAQVGKKLFTQAMEGNTTAIIFWLKAQAGWKDRTETTHIGDPMQPIVVSERAGNW
jgi:hypothetical protein